MRIICLNDTQGNVQEVRILAGGQKSESELLSAFTLFLAKTRQEYVSLPGETTKELQSLLERYKIVRLPIGFCSICSEPIAYEFDHSLRAVFLNETCRCRTTTRQNVTWRHFGQQISIFLQNELKYSQMQKSMAETTFQLLLSELSRGKW